ncbi:MAG TPA: LysR family transcriptional regulator [Steroidobacteraceae bacterium]|nr:LysR family transcriptional regulator [Steroidobacteraceae bacterium]
MDRLQAMRVFVRVLDRRSLTTAAADLRVSLPTVSRTLRLLERDLGVRLIARTTRGLTETYSGRLYYQHCRRLLDGLREAEIAVQTLAKAAMGELRITAPVAFGRHHIGPSIAAFLERNPRVSCFLSLSDQCESLADQRFDVAIRVAPLRDENLSVRRLGYVQRAVVGSKEYFERYPVPTHPRDLARHNCMQFTRYSRGDEWTFQQGGRPICVRVRGRVRTDNQEALVDAALAGAGLAILPTWLVQRELESGRLQRVLTDFEAARTPVHAVFPTPGMQPSKVRAFVDFIAQRLRAHNTLASEPLPDDAVA